MPTPARKTEARVSDRQECCRRWRSVKRIELLLFVVVFATHAYFYNGGGWNQDARLDVIYSFVEPGTPDYLTFRINRFITDPERGINTGDWSYFNGNYYSNKAPGTAFIGIPLYFFLHRIESMLGFDHYTAFARHFNAYLLNLWISVFFSSVASVVLLRFLLRYLDHTLSDAVFITFVFALGTLVFPFDSQLWGHTTSASLVLLSFYALLTRSSWGSTLAGFFLGMGLSTEYLVGVCLPVAGLYILTRRNGLHRILQFSAGALLPILLLLVYHKVNFGAFLTTAASSAVNNPIMLEEGAFEGQFTTFSFATLAKLLFSDQRGMFIYMPVLLMAVVGAPELHRRGKTAPMLVCLGVVAATLGALSCFIRWDMGWTSGPRHLIFSLPFWCLLLPSLSRRGPVTHWLLVITAALSVANMLVINTVNTMDKFTVRNPLYGQLYPEFFRGNVHAAGVDGPLNNLGAVVLGLEGLWSIAPLVVLGLAGGLYLAYLLKQPPLDAGSDRGT